MLSRRQASMVRVRQVLVSTLVMVCILALSTTAEAADVEFSVSQRETEVGVPVTLTVEIINATNYDRPQLPEIPGATVLAIPGEQSSSMTTIINGQTTQRNSRKLTFRITPTKHGTLSIPSIQVTADGKMFSSQQIDVIVSKVDPATTSDLLLVDIHSTKEAIYLGQSLDVTLRIWIRPYQDKQFNVRLDSNNMWQMLDATATSWGGFESALAKLRDPFGGLRIPTQEVLREDGQGNQRSYFLYEIPATIWPQQAGKLSIDPPHIVVNYPAKLGRQDDIFGRIGITQTRTVAATAESPDVEVKLPPIQGQPTTFNGAVGRFDITASAAPLEVSVGDPITLTIRIFDRNGGESPEGRLALLPPPPLDRMPEITEHFRMPADPLAGTVSGTVKTFTQTLRAKDASITQIPPIPLTYFDPDSATYVTRQSDPIPITVKPGSQLGLNDVVQSNGLTTPSVSSDLKLTAGGILANYPPSPAMLSSEEFHFDTLGIAVLLVPPIACAIVWTLRITSIRRQKHGGAIRSRGAAKRAAARLKSARSMNAPQQAAMVLSTMSEYFSDRLNLNGRTLTSGDLLELARRQRIEESHAAEFKALLDECEQIAYTGHNESNATDLPMRAVKCVDRLETSRGWQS